MAYGMLTGEHLQVGDVVVTSGTERQLLSRLLMWAMSSRWTHVFIVGPQGQLFESAFPHGVQTSSVADRLAELVREGRQARVLRVPQLTPADATAVAAAAQSMKGRKYDVLQAVFYGVCRHFIKDGPLRVICSRYITAAYAAQAVELFPAAVLDVRAGRDDPRYAELRKGWCAPQDFLDFSVLEDVTNTLILHAA